MRAKKHYLIYLSITILILLTAACSSQEGTETKTASKSSDQNTPVEDSKQITLTVGTPADLGVMEGFFKPIDEHFQNITFKFVSFDSKDPEKSYAAGVIPDLIQQGEPANENQLGYDMFMPLDDLIEVNNFDLDQFQPGLIENYRSYVPDHKLYTLPYDLATWGLYYNKDIFDRFGLEYPQPGITWNEVIDLAAKLTREQDGVKYQGFMPYPLWAIAQQIGFEYLDPKTDKPVYQDNDKLKFILNLYEKLKDIPGNVPVDGTNTFVNGDPFGGFQGTRTIAMATSWNNNLPYSQTDGLNWGVVNWPLMGNGPHNYGPEATGQTIGISAQTKYPDEAFKVVEYMLSPEYQRWMSNDNGHAPAIKDDAALEAFYNFGGLEDKNVESLIKYGYNPGTSSRSEYVSLSNQQSILYWGVKELLTEGTDINTIMRKMQEKAEAALKDVKEKQ